MSGLGALDVNDKSNEDKELLLDNVIDLLANRASKSGVRLYLENILKTQRQSEIEPKISSKALDRLVELAEKEINDRLGKSVLEHKATSLAFYCSVIRNPSSTIACKIKAQTRIDVLLGLEAESFDDTPDNIAMQIKKALDSMENVMNSDTENSLLDAVIDE